jgi:esterase/lipase superfamily enzyme
MVQWRTRKAARFRHDISLIDLTDVKADDSSNHDKFAQPAAVAPQLRSALGRGLRVNSQAGARMKGAIGDSLGALVALPIAILGAPVKIIAGN